MVEGKIILLVDDDTTLREMYNERLKIEGFEIVQATDGAEALQKMSEIKPDIILLDVMMPKFNGFEVLQQLKENPESKDIPVIILTVLTQDKDRLQGIQLGVTDYIVKSETMPGDVIAKIKAILG